MAIIEIAAAVFAVWYAMGWIAMGFFLPYDKQDDPRSWTSPNFVVRTRMLAYSIAPFLGGYALWEVIQAPMTSCGWSLRVSTLPSDKAWDHMEIAGHIELKRTHPAVDRDTATLILKIPGEKNHTKLYDGPWPPTREAMMGSLAKVFADSLSVKD